MKSVICVYNGVELGHGERLTVGKIYDVISVGDLPRGNPFLKNRSAGNFICIKDNKGDVSSYVMISDDKVWFEDATPYIREDKLNELGI